jgi:hypothetical protein
MCGAALPETVRENHMNPLLAISSEPPENHGCLCVHGPSGNDRTLPAFPRTRTPVRYRSPELVSEKLGDEVGQNPE